MSDFRIDQITNQAGTAGPNIAGITTFSSTSGLLMPSGPTEYRGGRGRGLFGGGGSGGNTNIISYITISTTSNAYDFGDLSVARRGISACSSSVRGIFAGQLGGNIIDYVTISSTGNALDFGDLVVNRFGAGAASNSVRGLFAGGYQPTGTIFAQSIDFITIASLGNASNFGDMIDKITGSSGVASSTRAVFLGGCKAESPTGVFNTIQYVTITTTGNAQDFGDLTQARDFGGAFSNSVRGILGGGDTETPATNNETNTIDYITISSLGDATDFGDLTLIRQRISGCCSSTRGIFGGGLTPGYVNTIDYVTIMSTGNAQDFGDLTTSIDEVGACSDAHGGLGD